MNLKAIILFALITHLPNDVICQDENKHEILNVTIAPVNKTPKLFVLTKETVASQILAKKLPINRVDHLFYLRLTRYALQPDSKSLIYEAIVWQESVYGVGPGLEWNFDLEYDPNSSRLFLVCSSQSSPKLSIWAYEIDPARVTQAKLGEFGPRGYAKPLDANVREKRLSDPFLKEYSVSRDRCRPEDQISSIIENDSILVSISQSPKENCQPAYFRFDFKTKKWKEIPYSGK